MAEGTPELPRRLEDLYITGGTPEEGTRDYLSVAHAPDLYESGDTVYVPISGGAGYGDPLQRDPKAVADDVSAGRCSEEAARDVYAVVIDDRTGLADEAGTQAKREPFARRGWHGPTL